MLGGSSSHSTGKRPLQEDDDNSTNNPPAKRSRFPKGKKGKPIDVIGEKVIVEENVNDLSNPVVAAKERMKRRNQITAELLSEEISNNISAAEVKYKVCFFRVFFDLSR
jgi:CD2 antigen cytoplasmic tail-binding protein 2